jgi:hypothetical protein
VDSIIDNSTTVYHIFAELLLKQTLFNLYYITLDTFIAFFLSLQRRRQVTDTSEFSAKVPIPQHHQLGAHQTHHGEKGNSKGPNRQADSGRWAGVALAACRSGAG